MAAVVQDVAAAVLNGPVAVAVVAGGVWVAVVGAPGHKPVLNTR